MTSGGVQGVVQLDLSGRTALVTGAASGIGRTCALRLAAAGASVIVVDRDGAAAETVAKAAGDLGTGAVATAVGADLSDLDGAEDLLAGHFAGGGDVLVNNAGL